MKLKDLREALGLSINEMAVAAGYEQPRSLRNIEKDNKGLSGPATTALRYLSQAVPNNVMPVFSWLDNIAGQSAVIRLHYPRFIALVGDHEQLNEFDGNPIIIDAAESLLIIMWIDQATTEIAKKAVDDALGWISADNENLLSAKHKSN